MGIAIIVHGGAWDIPEELHAEHIWGCRSAADAGWAVLSRGGEALDAVEAAVRVMEDHPVFDAGHGSVLNRDGLIELDAGIMDGRTLALGAVGAVRGIANPITLARHVLNDRHHSFLVGAGAELFAREVGLPFCDPKELVVERERLIWEARAASGSGTGAEFGIEPADTVGAVAIDSDGNIAVGNSTGGTLFKHPGRVGDTPMVGCGLYADNHTGGAACTGWGEQIMKTVLAKTATDQIALLGDALLAARSAIAHFQHRIGGLGGVICVTPAGQIGWAFSTPNLAYAYRSAEMTATVAEMGFRS